MLRLSSSLLVLGGAASGKSDFAEKIVLANSEQPIYIATGCAMDSEMSAKIATHRRRRGECWSTVEEPIEIAKILCQEDDGEKIFLVDCLTLWLTNLLAQNLDVVEEIDKLVAALDKLHGRVVLVSNELGLGIVPQNYDVRDFRNLHGAMNQSIAAAIDTVIFVTAGLPLILKGGKD